MNSDAGDRSGSLPRKQDATAAILAQWARERPDLDAAPMGVLGRVTRMSDAALRPIERNLARFGLEDGLFDVAAALRRAGAPHALTPGRLAASTMRTTGATTKRIDRLVAAGLAERERDPADGRGVLVRLTEEGRERVDAAVTAHLAVEEQLLAALSPRERTTLARLLAKLLLDVEGDGDAA